MSEEARSAAEEARDQVLEVVGDVPLSRALKLLAGRHEQSADLLGHLAMMIAIAESVEDEEVVAMAAGAAVLLADITAPVFDAVLNRCRAISEAASD